MCIESSAMFRKSLGRLSQRARNLLLRLLSSRLQRKWILLCGHRRVRDRQRWLQQVAFRSMYQYDGFEDMWSVSNGIPRRWHNLCLCWKLRHQQRRLLPIGQVYRKRCTHELLRVMSLSQRHGGRWNWSERVSTIDGCSRSHSLPQQSLCTRQMRCRWSILHLRVQSWIHRSDMQRSSRALQSEPLQEQRCLRVLKRRSHL